MKEDGDRIILEDNDLSELIAGMPDDAGVTVVNSDKLKEGEYGYRIKQITRQMLEEMGNDDSKFHVVFMASRPGASSFMAHLEHNHFEPETPLNDEFGYIMYKWQGELWIVVSIPSHKSQTAYSSAKDTQMKLDEGIPMMIGGDGVAQFPLVGNVRSLTNLPNDVVYQGQGGVQERLTEDRYVATKIVEKTQSKYK